MKHTSRKRMTALLPVSFAMLAIMLFSIIPHHHHKQIVCTIIEECIHHSKSDQHNQNHDNHSDNESTCISSLKYIKASSAERNNSLSNDIKYPLSQSGIIFENCTLLPSPALSGTASGLQNIYFISTLQSIVVPINGLRAPPFLS